MSASIIIKDNNNKIDIDGDLSSNLIKFKKTKFFRK